MGAGFTFLFYYFSPPPLNSSAPKQHLLLLTSITNTSPTCPESRGEDKKCEDKIKSYLTKAVEIQTLVISSGIISSVNQRSLFVLTEVSHYPTLPQKGQNLSG